MKVDYIGYLKYILEHKKNVFKTCWKRGLYLHAFTHDLSKFLPSEFIPYAKWFYGEYGVRWNGGTCNSWEFDEHNKCKQDFDYAWEHHQVKNKHHWNYWTYDIDEYYSNMGELGRFKLKQPKDMPLKYIKQMICDWEGMALKFGDTAQQFYMNNYGKIELSLKSRLELEVELGLIDETCLISNVTWKDYCERNDITMEEDLIKLGYMKSE